MTNFLSNFRLALHYHFFCKNKHGNVVGGERSVLQLWADCYKELLNPLRLGDYTRRKFCFGQKQNIRGHSKQVSAIVGELRNNMAPGDDVMTAELVKGGGRMLRREVHTFCRSRESGREEQVPEEWNNARR